MAAVLALCSAMVYGAGDFLGGLGARRIPAAAVVLRVHLVGLVGLALVAPLVAAGEVRSHDLLVGAAAGLVGGVGLLLLYQGLAGGTMSVVAPVTAVLAAVVPVTAGLLDGERPGLGALAGVLLALAAIALLAREPGDPGPPRPPDLGEPGLAPTRALLLALGAGLGFGLFFVGLDAAGDDAGMWPLVAGRVASVTTFGLVAALSPASRAGRGAAWAGTTPRLLVGCGLCDSGANALFLLATHHGLLTLVAVLGSLYPASTVGLATTLAHERLASHQLAGVVLALGAVVLITAG